MLYSVHKWNSDPVESWTKVEKLGLTNELYVRCNEIKQKQRLRM